MNKKKKMYEVTIQAKITKTFFVEALNKMYAEDEAMELFNPHSGEAEERYEQEVVGVRNI